MKLKSEPYFNMKYKIWIWNYFWICRNYTAMLLYPKLVGTPCKVDSIPWLCGGRNGECGLEWRGKGRDWRMTFRQFAYLYSLLSLRLLSSLSGLEKSIVQVVAELPLWHTLTAALLLHATLVKCNRVTPLFHGGTHKRNQSTKTVKNRLNFLTKLIILGFVPLPFQ